MQLDIFLVILLIIGLTSSIFYGMYRVSRYGFVVNFLMLAGSYQSNATSVLRTFLMAYAMQRQKDGSEN